MEVISAPAFNDVQTEFASQIRLAVEGFKVGGKPPTWDRTLHQQLCAFGLQELVVDNELRRYPENALLALITTELIASWNPSAAAALHSGRTHRLLLAGMTRSTVRDQYLRATADGTILGAMAISEECAGSDLRGLQAVAHRTARGWELTGRKSWISFAPVCDFAFVLAKIESSSRDAEMGVFLVPMDLPGVDRGANHNEFSFQDHPNGEIRFDGVQLSADYVLTDRGGLGVTLSAITMARLEASALSVGLMKGLLETASEHTNARQIYEGRLADLPTVQHSLGGAVADYRGARALLHEIAGKGLDSVSKEDAMLAKVVATETAARVGRRVVTSLGAAGVVAGSAVSRFRQYAEAATIFDGVTDAILISLGRSWLAHRWHAI